MQVEIYTKDKCPYCFRAKTALTNKGIPYTEQKLGVDFTREMLLEKYSLAKTYPVIVVDGFFIGGYDELTTLLEEEQTNQKLLNEGD